MSKALTVRPAYGRDYNSAKEVTAAWEAGKDFQVATPFSPYSGSYLNKSEAADMRADGFTELHVRYARSTKVHVQKLVQA